MLTLETSSELPALRSSLVMALGSGWLNSEEVSIFKGKHTHSLKLKVLFDSDLMLKEDVGICQCCWKLSTSSLFGWIPIRLLL